MKFKSICMRYLEYMTRISNKQNVNSTIVKKRHVTHHAYRIHNHHILHLVHYLSLSTIHAPWHEKTGINGIVWNMPWCYASWQSWKNHLILVLHFTFICWYAPCLIQEFTVFFHAYFNKVVTWSDRMEFVNAWYILVIVSDALTIAGSAFKIGIQAKVCLALWFSHGIMKILIEKSHLKDFMFSLAVPDKLRCLQHPSGYSHAARLGRSHSLPWLLQEIQCESLAAAFSSASASMYGK